MRLYGLRSYLASLQIYTWKIDLGHEGDIRRDIWVLLAAVDLEAVDSVLVHALITDLAIEMGESFQYKHEEALGLSHSSSTSASRRHLGDHTSKPLSWVSLGPIERCYGIVPAPRPFSPFSSSSSNLKFRGTFAPMMKLSGVEVQNWAQMHFWELEEILHSMDFTEYGEDSTCDGEH